MFDYSAEIISVYDGDTLTAICDLGFNTFKKVKVRLGRINTPEIRTRDKEEKVKGYAARDYLREILAKSPDRIKICTTKKGKYGRWIGELYIRGKNINDLLVKKGHAEYKDY